MNSRHHGPSLWLSVATRLLSGLVGLMLVGSCRPSPSTQSQPTTTTASTTPARPGTSATSTSILGPSFSSSLPAGYLVYGRAGISYFGADGSSGQISDTPTAAAFAVTPDLVVSQEAGDLDVHPPARAWGFQILRPDSDPSLVVVSSRQLSLYDAGLINGRPFALATMINWLGQDTYEDLLLVNIDPAPSNDSGDMFTTLARVGSWEDMVLNADLGQGVIVLTTPGTLEARDLAGDILWRSRTDRSESPFLIMGSELLMVRGRFVDPDFQPVLDLQTYELLTGRLLEERSLELDAQFDGGFCMVVAWDGSRLVCDESYGGPFTVDLETGSVTAISNLDDGMAAIIGG